MRKLFSYFLAGFVLLSCHTESKQVNLNKAIEENHFRSHPLSSKQLPVFTVQISRLPADTLQVLSDDRRELRDRISDSLWKKQVGIRLGTNRTPTSTDLNFRVLDPQVALPIIVSILEKEGVAERSKILKKTHVNTDSSQTELVYPSD